ncbi:serine phosphatase RsbU (regulator of sigma subunit) [Clavibacter michiganensis]|uniref:PP2C family protein-serine/threonine phosphatase n=1 Tax=Clavibacter michiganensis TaxID=28447 RepID=UPI001AE83359|nr:SpoIIE family protein phosphatase [Clavibacter michiganensis]MBP2458954.1 serine phosphatase RsbU (regulator of sigma subunit) [Clavibacter michiganensis]MDQ0411526.1 serine phosphatase RsbU (regulator of sigma subunit) [Clavibacter michiganensis]
MTLIEDARSAASQRAVEALGLLDGPPEERFDRVTRIARTAFAVPLSTIGIADHDRMWFASCSGADVTETTISNNFCDTTVREERVLIVEDAQAHPVFRHLPTVAGAPHIRFYAGHPLRDAEGLVIGTFCLYDFEPRGLDAGQLALFAELADWAQRELLASAEMDRAQAVQSALLPAAEVEIPGYEIAAVCVPAQVVGGDFYDYERTASGLRFSIADVMGKGTGAAILTATVRAVLRGIASTADRYGAGVLEDTGLMVTDAARSLEADLDRTGAFVTLQHGHLDQASGLLRYADAGHGLTIIVHADGRVTHLDTSDLPVGIDADHRWEERHAVLGHGDTFVTFSDGLFDMFGGSQPAFALIGRLVTESGGVHALVERVRGLASAGTPLDDVSVLAVSRA